MKSPFTLLLTAAPELLAASLRASLKVGFPLRLWALPGSHCASTRGRKISLVIGHVSSRGLGLRLGFPEEDPETRIYVPPRR